MKYSIIVTSSGLGNQSAIDFASALLSSLHEIHRVFFYGDGVLNSTYDSPQSLQWQQLHRSHKLDLVVCVTAAKKRGLLDKDSLIRKEFIVSGLGQLADAAVHSDRTITFR